MELIIRGKPHEIKEVLQAIEGSKEHKKIKANLVTHISQQN
ncbi:hypothetical protein [Paucilactobacillus sp. N302-9]